MLQNMAQGIRIHRADQPILRADEPHLDAHGGGYGSSLFAPCTYKFHQIPVPQSQAAIFGQAAKVSGTAEAGPTDAQLEDELIW